MNERCARFDCGHSPASHDLWGTGGCEAQGCRCYQYETPAAYATGLEHARQVAQQARLHTGRWTNAGTMDVRLA